MHIHAYEQTCVKLLCSLISPLHRALDVPAEYPSRAEWGWILRALRSWSGNSRDSRRLCLDTTNPFWVLPFSLSLPILKNVHQSSIDISLSLCRSRLLPQSYCIVRCHICKFFKYFPPIQNLHLRTTVDSSVASKSHACVECQRWVWWCEKEPWFPSRLRYYRRGHIRLTLHLSIVLQDVFIVDIDGIQAHG